VLRSAIERRWRGAKGEVRVEVVLELRCRRFTWGGWRWRLRRQFVEGRRRREAGIAGSVACMIRRGGLEVVGGCQWLQVVRL